MLVFFLNTVFAHFQQICSATCFNAGECFTDFMLVFRSLYCTLLTFHHPNSDGWFVHGKKKKLPREFGQFIVV